MKQNDLMTIDEITVAWVSLSLSLFISEYLAPSVSDSIELANRSS